MESLASLEALMEETIGLSTGAIGKEFFQKVVARRMAACRLSSTQDYYDLLTTSNPEMKELIEELTIPETWFFRNRKQLEYLADHIRNTWLLSRQGSNLRILSIPCATGEEPYTIAMILFDMGFPPGRFHIDAVDISAYVLKKAKGAVFEKVSFRGDSLQYRERYFQETPDGYLLIPAIRETVTFLQGNIIAETFLTNTPPYDIILSRNLFIYFSNSAKKKAAAVLQRLLNIGGLLFMGHAEEYPFAENQMERIRQVGIFAYRRVAASDKPAKTASKAPSPPPRAPVATKGPSPAPAPGPIAVPKPAETPQIPVRPKYQADNAKLPSQGKGELPELFDKARHLADQGDLDSAFALCEEIIKRNSGFVEAYFLQGVICGARDDNHQAGECFNRVLYLKPSHLDALQHLLILAEQAGDRMKATRIKERMDRIRNKTEAP